MKKLHRGGSSPDGEPLSAGRVEYLEAARQRVRRRRLRRTAILSDGAYTGHSVCHRRGGCIHRPGKGYGGYGAHRPVPGGGLAAADRPWRFNGSAAHVRQLCSHGRGCLRGVQLGRHPPCRHPERLRPPGAGCGQDPLCAVQPLRQRAAGGKPHPEPLQQNAGKQHLSVCHVGHRHAGSGNGLCRQHRPADRVYPHHERTAALGYDRHAGHPGADGFCRRQPPSWRWRLSPPAPDSCRRISLCSALRRATRCS